MYLSINTSSGCGDKMNQKTHKLLQEKFPFLTIITYLETEYIGIIQHSDNNFVSIYIMDTNFTNEMKKDFLECGDTWWWESNRSIPINLFLRDKFKKFKPWLRTFARKETVIVEGPSINMMDLINRKLKKRTIQLVKFPS
jgi:hypothetical protein